MRASSNVVLAAMLAFASGCGLLLGTGDGPPSTRSDSGTSDAGSLDGGRDGARDAARDGAAEDAGGGTCASPAACDDGDLCNGAEICDPTSGCLPGETPTCSDSIDCTHDSCESRMGCAHTPNDALCTLGPGGRCDAALGCQYESCNATTCASDRCWSRSCDAAGVCQPVFACAAEQECCNGMCVPLGCDDGNPCTADFCDPSTGCSSRALAAGTWCSTSPGVPGTCDAVGNCCDASNDCDGDGICECLSGVCSMGACSSGCMTSLECPMGQLCCLEAVGFFGRCYSAACDDCCRPGA